jgi:type IV secretory pathway VirB9-like protein
MNSSFEQTLIKVWRQALVENAKVVELGKEHYPVRRTPKRGLRQVDFVFDEDEIRGLEQNPETKSRWAQMARSGKKVMQFLSEGRYVANVVEGKVTLYGRGGKNQ